MKQRLIGLVGFLLALILGACGDLPTAPPSPDLAGPVLSSECTLKSDGTFLCPPEEPDWGDGCEWYQACGGDCMAAAGTNPTGETRVQGCTGGGDDGGTGGGEVPGGPGGGGDGGDDGGGGDDGSGGRICPDYGCPPSDEDPECDPRFDPTCEQPLTAVDSATILNALATMLRPATAFTDTIARSDCQRMTTWFNEAFAAGAVFRGAYDSNDVADPAHWGMYNNGNIHFDPAGLDAANAGNTDAIREIAITALHEAAHRMGYAHPTAPTFDALGRDYYVDHPFNRLNPGPNSCVPR